jgi:hypothetical protein
VGPAAFGWCPLGFYDTPVVVGSGFYPWVYVPHSYIYSDNIYRHSYSYSDVSRYRLEQNNVVLRQQLYARPGARPEVFGAATYRRALADPRLIQARTGASVGGGVARAPFNVNEQRTYRRAVLEHQAVSQRQRTTGGGKFGAPVPPRPTSGWQGVNGNGASRTDPRMLNRHEVGLRPGVAPPQRSSYNDGRRAGDSSISPAAGRPIRPPVRMVPENERQPSNLTPGRVQPQEGGRQGDAAAPQQRMPLVHRSERSSQTAPPAVRQSPGPADYPDHQAATPHPRADAGRRGSGGPFVMPSRPSAVHAPSHPAARPQVAEKSKGGGRRR